MIGERRVCKAIAKHEAAGGERGLDNVGYELRARCVNDECLAERPEVQPRLHEQRPQAITERSTARLARDGVRDAEQR